MPYIQLNDRQYALTVGETRVGGGEQIPLPDAPPGPQALIKVGNRQDVSIRRATAESVVRVNDVQLGVEPTPLLHGDKIEIGSHELLFGDDRKGGSTQYLTPLEIPLLKARPPRAGGAASGGRLVSLVDGREFPVPAHGLTIGRDASCEVVLPGTDVSRRHAQVSLGEAGYTITDMSTNGILVNGAPVAGSQVLARGDVVRVGQEEFRFYANFASADAPFPAAPAPAPAVSPPPAASHVSPVAPIDAVLPPAPSPLPGLEGSTPPTAPLAGTPPVATPPSPSPQGASRTPAAAPAASIPTPVLPMAPAPDARPVLARLEVTSEGLIKGRTHEIRSPLTHIGRGAHNDIVLPDESVSDAHAKIQRRDGGWFVVDMGSTNGTYVGGRRVAGELLLHGRAELRFGGIKVAFRPQVDATRPLTSAPDEAKGTRVIVGVSTDVAGRPSPSATRRPRPTEPPPTSDRRQTRAVLLTLLAVVLAAAFIFFVER
ncbi:MAG: hypothetical protein NVS9B3_16090 [Gemmatimonadaceae bacterium]